MRMCQRQDVIACSTAAILQAVYTIDSASNHIRWMPDLSFVGLVVDDPAASSLRWFIVIRVISGHTSVQYTELKTFPVPQVTTLVINEA